MAARISIKRLAGLVKTGRETALRLARAALAGHRARAFVAREQRAVAGHVGATAAAANAICDFGDGTHGIEERDERGHVGELLRCRHVGAGDSGARIGMRLVGAFAEYGRMRTRDRSRRQECGERTKARGDEGATGKS